MPVTASIALTLLALACPQAPAAEIRSPEAVFGHPVGADRKLVPYQRIVEYLRSLEAASPWIKVEKLGKTTLGLDHVMAVIGKPEVTAKAARWQEISRQLLDPRLTIPAAAMAAEGKVAVMITCGIHSDEVASPQTAIELAYEIVANKNLTFDREKVFDDVVLLLVPSVNPDGQEMVADWVARTAGTENEGAPMPKLYHFFAGHDDNRDWFAFNLIETRNIAHVLTQTWRPQVLVDHHQMGSRGARFFCPPYGDPLNKAVDPLVWRGAALFGNAMAFELEGAGKTGVAHDAYFQGWWQGGLSRAPWWHHGIGILTESASPALASPLQLDEAELEASGGIPTMGAPTARMQSVWEGGTWRVRDVCDYQRIATYATLRLASQRREEILMNTYRMAQRAMERMAKEGPAGYVMPAQQRDPAARDRLVDMLQLNGIEVRRLSVPMTIAGVTYPAGSDLIATAQPFGPLVRDLLEDQTYPDFSSAQRPYDVVGWTLWRMMGVECDRIAEPFEIPADSALVTALTPRSTIRKSEKGAAWFAIDPRSNDAFLAARNLIGESKPVRRALEAQLAESGARVPAGSFLLTAKELEGDTSWLTQGISIDVVPLASEPAGKVATYPGVRIGLYEAWDPSMDKGWAHLIVDKYAWKPQLIHNADLERTLPLLDCFLIPESSPDVLWDGGSKSDTKGTRVPFPKEFRGGLGADGVKLLRKFVEEQGGTLVALGSSCDFLIERMDLPVTNALKGVKREEFSCPGSLVRLLCDSDHPIGFGMERETAAFFASNVAFRTTPPNGRFERSVIARYPDEPGLLLSGHLKGEEKLRGLAAAVELKLGKGRIVLFGLRPHHRAQTDATFKLLINAMMVGMMKM